VVTRIGHNAIKVRRILLTFLSRAGRPLAAILPANSPEVIFVLAPAVFDLADEHNVEVTD
jgi:hypothetical protein